MESTAVPRSLTDGHALAGRPDRAMECLHVAVSRGFINHPFLARWNPLLSSVRRESEFERLMAEVRERSERFRPEGEQPLAGAGAPR